MQWGGCCCASSGAFVVRGAGERLCLPLCAVRVAATGCYPWWRARVVCGSLSSGGVKVICLGLFYVHVLCGHGGAGCLGVCRSCQLFTGGVLPGEGCVLARVTCIGVHAGKVWRSCRQASCLWPAVADIVRVDIVTARNPWQLCSQMTCPVSLVATGLARALVRGHRVPLDGTTVWRGVHCGRIVADTSAPCRPRDSADAHSMVPITTERRATSVFCTHMSRCPTSSVKTTPVVTSVQGVV